MALKNIRTGMYITLGNEPYQVLSADFMKKAQRKPVMRTKLRNLITQSVIEHSFKPGTEPEIADLEKSEAQFLYAQNDEAFFMDTVSFDQFSLPKKLLGSVTDFIKEGQNVQVLRYNDRPVAVSMPAKVDLKVTESPPATKGNSSSNVYKQVVLETGMTISVPLFINEGDSIRVNTGTGEYIERV